jgi:hypothetical protein
MFILFCRAGFFVFAAVDFAAAFGLTACPDATASVLLFFATTEILPDYDLACPARDATFATFICAKFLAP